jgi:hypothetical protein
MHSIEMRTEAFWRFFRYIVNLLIDQDSDHTRRIILFDEFPVMINLQEQSILYKIIEELSQNNQIILPSQSFCSMNNNYPRGIRTIKKSPEKGTEIHDIGFSGIRALKKAKSINKGQQQSLTGY